jgi:hypothetical protein
MWLATQHGFYSIVQPGSDLYFVRARLRQDLENLKELVGLDDEIYEWPQAAYRFRIMVDLETLLEIMVKMTTALDYSNFKGRIYEREEQSHKLGCYQRVWEIVGELQQDGPSLNVR